MWPRSFRSFARMLWAACLVMPVVVHAEPPGAEALLRELDAPLLLVKRHAYFSPHIYDDAFVYQPGGGIYILENPADPQDQQRLRPVIDPTTPQTLGEGVYRDPDVSWDGRRIVFAFKGEADGDTSIYEIGLDGRGLRRLTNPAASACYRQSHERVWGKGVHDYRPTYLPDGRIVFLSTRQGTLVPCFNNTVATLHIIDGDGRNMRSLSVNNVTEFDPAVLPDGRVLFARWEYVDKSALYIQSLWTIRPDGTGEEALFANNLAKPTSVLRGRPVPGAPGLISAVLTPHNGQPVGAVVMIDPARGANNLDAITNFTPEHPIEMDQGLSRGPTDPWPLSRDLVLMSDNTKGHASIQLVHRDGRRVVIRQEPDIGCFAPMLLWPRPTPPAIADAASLMPGESHAPPHAGTFFVQDVYEGLTGVKRGEVKWLRIVEETARRSGVPAGGRWWNQAFLVSWQGAYTIKNFIGVVPVEPDGSAYFQAPAGRAIYFQLLDERGQMLQSMRTFIQAMPGVTRSCVGCHEPRNQSPRPGGGIASALALRRAPSVPEPEPWGSGYIDYAGMIQPIWDRHCTACHGGPENIAAGIDLTGGWTWAFSLSYENLIQNNLVGFINCENGSIPSTQVQPPRTHGSGAAPLSELLASDHRGVKLSEAERRLVLAWMDGNSNYFGTWDYSDHATIDSIRAVGAKLAAIMTQAGCSKCHAQVGHDWINLQTPALSRILRAPLAAGEQGHGLAWCRDRKARSKRPLVVSSHQPPDVFSAAAMITPDLSGEPVIGFVDTRDKHYRAMLAAIEAGRAEALSRPRVDMPGAIVHAGIIRRHTTRLPEQLPAPSGVVEPDGVVTLRWPSSGETAGLSFEIHRGESPSFEPDGRTLIATTTRFGFDDLHAPAGPAHYALVVCADDQRSEPIRLTLSVPATGDLPPPTNLTATPLAGQVQLTWHPAPGLHIRHEITRRSGDGEAVAVSDVPLAAAQVIDTPPRPDVASTYEVRSVDRRGRRSAAVSVTATPLPEPQDPVFTAPHADGVARTASGEIAGKLDGAARVADGAVQIAGEGFVKFAPDEHFEASRRFSISFRVRRSDGPAKMPVVLSAGRFNERGWFMQLINGRWRFHLGGVSVDGGNCPPGKWIHLVGTFDGQTMRLYQDGKQVGSAPAFDTPRWDGDLLIGHYDGRSPQYQWSGEIADVRIYRCVLSDEKIARIQHEPFPRVPAKPAEPAPAN